MVDMDNPDDMIEELFVSFYNIVGKEQIDGLEFNITAILSQLVDEIQEPSRDVSKIILSHLLNEGLEHGDDELNGGGGEEDGDEDHEHNKKKRAKPKPKAKGGTKKSMVVASNATIPIISRGYNVSKTLCLDNVDIMTRAVNQYIADVLNPILLGKVDDSTEVTKELRKLGNLILSIWKSVPDLLVNVLGQLEHNLSVENFPLRYMSTKVLGEMISFDGSRVNFVNEYNSAYKAWVGRYRDVNPQIRIAWATHVPNFVKNQTNRGILTESVIPFLGLLDDSDEKVRMAICNLISEIDIDTIATIYTIATPQPLSALANRLRDKKATVRSAAFQAVGKIYDDAYDQIMADNQQIAEVTSWIPSHILGLLYVDDLEINEKLDLVFFDYIYSFTKIGNGDDDESSVYRAKRLLNIVKALNEESFKAFNAISSRQVKIAKYLNTLLTFAKEYHTIDKQKTMMGKKTGGNKDELKKKATALIKWVSTLYPDSNRVVADLTEFFDTSNPVAYKLFANCINPDSDYKTVYNSYHTFMEHIGKEFQATFKPILYRCSFILFNKSNVSSIIEVSRTNSKLQDISHVVLKEVAEIQPSLMKSQTQEITSIIENSKPTDKGLVDTLKTAKLLFSKFPDLVPTSTIIWESLLDIAKNGNIKEAKQATNVLNFAPRKIQTLTTLIDGLEEILSLPYDKVPDNFSTLLSCISRLYYNNPEIIEPYSGIIMNFLVRNVLVSNQLMPAKEGDPEWVNDKDDSRGSIVNYKDEEVVIEEDETHTNGNTQPSLEHLNRKLLALKIMVNRTRSPYLDPDSALEVSKPILKVLMSLMVNSGELSNTHDTPPHYKSRLRLEAGVQLIKLSQLGFCLKQIGPKELSTLGTLIKDSQLEVRDKFILKLTSLLSDGSLPERFLCLVFFIAGESNKPLLEYSIRWIKARYTKQLKNTQKNSMALEHSLVRVLHVLSHSGIFEDYEKENEEEKSEEEVLSSSLIRASKYIIFYLKLIATKDNISLLFYLSQRVKEYQDVIEEDSKSLYTIADLAQICILQLNQVRNWEAMVAWPGSASLPKDSFKLIKSSFEAKKVLETSFIPEEIVKKLQENIQKSLNVQHHKIRTDIGSEEVEKKITKKRSSLGSAAKNKRVKSGSTGSKFKSLTRASQEKIEPSRRSARTAAKKVNYEEEREEGEEDEEEEESTEEETDEDA